MTEPLAAAGPGIEPRILQEAAQWLAQMQEAPLNPAEQQRLAQWRGQSAQHQRAWSRAERLLARVQGLPPDIAKPTLGRPGDAPGRRRVLHGIATALLLAPAGWLLWRSQPWRDWLAADHVALTGEQHDAALEDGSQISLNTDTALDVRFDARQRLLRLRRGEVYIRTAPDSASPARPFLVQTAQGRLLALGTRFSVRQFDGATLLAVYEGAVQIRPDDADTARHLTLQAGQQARFTRDGIDPPAAATEDAAAWRQGLLVADDMPLPQWADELARYSGKTIHVGAAQRALRISGSFPVHDLPRALRMLADTHRVTVRIEGQTVWIGA
ncbi:MAG: FecR family protein [Ottowia sp.]|uniref:FecR family protein n=1 Tax=Ottowia sp. TaxID=1898956 RepID=UPI0039E6A19A